MHLTFASDLKTGSLVVVCNSLLSMDQLLIDKRFLPLLEERTRSRDERFFMEVQGKRCLTLSTGALRQIRMLALSGF